MTQGDDRQRLRRFVAASNELHRAHLDTDAKRDAYSRFVDVQVAYFVPLYADLRERPGYGPAIDFVISDLVGPGIADRDRDLEKVVPIMSRTLPKRALAALATAMELNAGVLKINLDLSQRLTPKIDIAGSVTELEYCLACREVTDYNEYRYLIGLTRDAGLSLERIVGMPMIAPLLRSMRGPARLAGFGDLQEFLEKGFSTFRQVEDVHAFLEVLETRMEQIFERVFNAAESELSTAPIGGGA